MTAALRELVRLADPALRQYAREDPPEGRWSGRLGDGDREFVFEGIYEAFLLHYGEPRAFAGMDEDMRLLAGDAVYALALERLAERGDLEAVAELADLISLSAQAQAEARHDAVPGLWAASAAALARRDGRDGDGEPRSRGDGGGGRTGAANGRAGAGRRGAGSTDGPPVAGSSSAAGDA